VILSTESEKVSKATTGAVSELVVAADLLRKGYEVFRAMSPACSCDLLINKNGSMKRIEVRSGYRTQDGMARCSFQPRDRGRSDILAIVLNGTGGVVYRETEDMRDIAL